MTDDPKRLDLDGYEIRPNVIPLKDSEEMIRNLGAILADQDLQYGTRDLLRIFPRIKEFLSISSLRSILCEYLKPDFFVVRCLYFDKFPTANWKVAWHQDLAITVNNRIDINDFGPWSHKGEDLYVQAPTRVLERMVAVRIHLDDCFEENGPLRVIKYSHRQGRLGIDEIKEIAKQGEQKICEVEKGGVMLMKPLVIHASSPSVKPLHRRVVHFELADFELPSGLEWRYRVI